MSELSTLKILLVLPMYGGSLPVGRYCERALKSLGHTVETFDAPAFYSSYEALNNLDVTGDRLEYLQNSYLQMVGNAIMAKVESCEPDLVLAMAQAPLSRQSLKRLKRDGVRTAMWFVEDHKVFSYWQAFAPLYDLFAVIQKEPFLAGLADVGQDNVLYLPMAADPDFHRPMDISSMERHKWGSKVSFMGAGYPNRRLAFRQLLKYDFKIWGTEWDEDSILISRVQMQGKRLTPEECVKVFNATDINLNLHSSIHTDKLVSHGDFLNPRTFELASCEAFQLVDRRSLLAESFEEDEVCVFDSLDELKEKIDYYLVHPEERAAMAEKARNKVASSHTYVHRMQQLLDFASERFDGWPTPRGKSASAFDILPEDLQQQTKQLLDRLGLPVTAAFEDVVNGVRKQQGKLNPLDASILFIDEWKKQYKK